MLPAEVPHPLDNLFTQFGNGQSHSLLAGVSFGPPVGQDWFSASDLANDDGALDHILERYGEIVKTDSRFLQAAMLMNLYIGPVVSPAVLGFYAGRAVTDASAPNFAIRLGETPWEAEYAFRCRHFATLSSDRAARHPDAIPAPSLEALNAWMFDKMLECHLSPLFARVRARTKLGENVMWAGVASGCAHAIMYLQRAGYFTIDEALAAKEALLEQVPSRCATVCRSTLWRAGLYAACSCAWRCAVRNTSTPIWASAATARCGRSRNSWNCSSLSSTAALRRKPPKFPRAPAAA